MTRTAFVIGHPVAHSRSPLLHRHWLSVYGIQGDYVRIDVPEDGLAAFCAKLADGAYVGGNVTIPHKQAVMAFCDRIDDTARIVGAVNTLVIADGGIFGSNSDCSGFVANLDAAAPGWDHDPGPALVLGAGGAARAVLLGLARRGFSPIRILNRSRARAVALAEQLAPALGVDLVGDALVGFAALAADARILVNTSSVGMNGTRFDGLDLAGLPQGALVTDIVYAPLRTQLLVDAAARGLHTVDGLGMLLHQAVPGFEAWFGRRPGVTAELRQLIETDLNPK